jgi:hypothetical protein
MAGPEAKRVFISYVHDDDAAVDALCAVLGAAQIPYWRDRDSLGPGDAWKAKIREAIREGSLVFIACFSEASRKREKSYQNEEITVAVEEFRQMAPGRTWLMPVRFDGSALPYWDLGAGRELSDLNYTDLFGPNHVPNVARLVVTIQRLIGDKHVDAVTAIAAVEEASAIDRTDLLRRLTKDMLPDPTRRIELDDLVSQEVKRLTTTLRDASRVAGPLGATNDEQIARLEAEANAYAQAALPFCASLQIAARWASPEQLVPWAAGIQTFVGATRRAEGGVAALVRFRHTPGVLGILTATLASVHVGNWQGLRVLVADRTVMDRFDAGRRSLLEATDIYEPFGDVNETVRSAFAAAAIEGRPVETVKDFPPNGHRGRYHTPDAEWFHAVLRPLFREEWPDDEAYDAEYDRAEAVLGVLAQDAINARRAASDNGRAWGRAYWYGRSTWRSKHSHGNPVADLHREFEAQGLQWGPLRAGLFGGSEERAKAALNDYGQTFQEAANRMGW